VTAQRIGLLGGMSWLSTMDYYRLLNEGTNHRLGAEHSTDLVLRSLDFQTLLDTVDHAGAVEDQLDAAADDLAAAGAAVLAVAAITAHRFTHRLEHRRDMRFVHVGQATSHALASHGARRPGLLATSITLRDAALVERITHGTEPILPDAGHRAALDEIIFGELIRGPASDTGQKVLARVIDELGANGADAILLACTELSTARPHLPTRLPILDTTALHCAAILETAASAGISTSSSL
jgi:aspartate racemase